MGPFGIAAVGLLANKGSGSKHKQSKGSSKGLAKPDGHDRCYMLSSKDLMLTEGGGGTLQRMRNTAFQIEEAPVQMGKQSRMPSALSGKGPSLVTKEESSSKIALTLGLHRVKTRAAPIAVRTVDSASDRSDCSPVSLGECEESLIKKPHELSKQTLTKSEHKPTKLQRSRRIKLDDTDSLISNVRSLSIDGTMNDLKNSRQDESSFDFEMVRASASIYPNDCQLKMTGRPGTDSCDDPSVNNIKSMHSYVASEIQSDISQASPSEVVV